jgi:hypothetical protein
LTLPSWFPSDNLLSGWKNIASKMNPWSVSGPDGQSTYCGTLDGGASVSFEVGAEETCSTAWHDVLHGHVKSASWTLRAPTSQAMRSQLCKLYQEHG